MADFAGTFDELVDFAKEHGFKAAKSLAHRSPNRLPMISLPFLNQRELRTGLAKFKEHGWDEDSVIVRRINVGARGGRRVER